MTTREAIDVVEDHMKFFTTSGDLRDALHVLLAASDKYVRKWSCEGCQSIRKKYICDFCCREKGCERESDRYCKAKEKK